jgi:hypothetical protein
MIRFGWKRNVGETGVLPRKFEKATVPPYTTPCDPVGGVEGDWALYLRGQALQALLQRPAGSYLIVSARWHAQPVDVYHRGAFRRTQIHLVCVCFENTLSHDLFSASYRWVIDTLNDRASETSNTSECTRALSDSSNFSMAG